MNRVYCLKSARYLIVHVRSPLLFQHCRRVLPGHWCFSIKDVLTLSSSPCFFCCTGALGMKRGFAASPKDSGRRLPLFCVAFVNHFFTRLFEEHLRILQSLFINFKL